MNGLSVHLKIPLHWIQLTTVQPSLSKSAIFGARVVSGCCWKVTVREIGEERTQKVVSDSPGLVDFAIGLVIFVLHLPDGQVLFFGEIQITEGL